MKTYTSQSAIDSTVHIITEIALSDVEDLKSNEVQFKAVMQRVVANIADEITKQLVPRIQDAIIAKIDVEAMVTEAARAKVKELLWPVAEREARGPSTRQGENSWSR